MKKIVFVLSVLTCLALLYMPAKGQIPAAYQVGTWQNFKPAAVSYTFDDNCSNQIPVAIPLLNNYGFKSTIFAITQNLNPNWNNMKTAANAGHEIASHTVTHTNLPDQNVASQDTELKNSQATINTQITNQKCYTVAYPNCNIGDLTTIQKYYIAGRTCSGQIINKSPNDFYTLSSIICGNTGVNTANDMNTRVGNAKTSGGWCVFLIHGIDNDGGYSPLASSVLGSHLSYVNTNTADYWVGTFGNVVKYIKERNGMSISETTVNADSLRMTPTDNLDNTIYDVAVTIRRQLPSTWTTARVMQGTTVITSTIVTISGVKYIQFDVVPDKGVYTLANASVTNPGCTTVAPTITSPLSYVQGATAAALTATGTALKWYGTNATGGTANTTAPTPVTTTVGSATYYVSQTLNGCEGPRAAIVVNITSSGTGTGTTTSCGETGQGAYYTGVYRNMFKELLNKTDAEVNAKVEAAFQQLFYGNTSQQVYYPVGTDMAYILDVANNDVRTEGMSYGMMICVQLDKQAEFDKIWKWAKTKMQRSDGFFNWQLNTNGTVKGNGPASDGEAYFITALLFASNRWGNGTGINNYGAEAQDILNRVMSQGGNSNLFNANSKLITFVPSGDSYTYTDPSYNLPGFWELWKRWSTTNTAFWAQTPDAARKLLRDASNPTSGLFADYANFDGTPKTTTFNSDSHRFMYDAWRTIMNLGMDYHWFQADAQQPVIAERYLTFFKNQGTSYKNHYDWNGTNAGGDHSTGLVACNAVASLAVNNATLTTPFVQEFWNTAIPNGTYRYYDGMLYMLGLLNCSGNMKIWKPECPNACTTPAPTVTAATVTYDLNATATQLTATGTALKWYTVATGGTALAAAPTPATTAVGTTVYYVGQTLNGCEGTRTSVTINVVNTYKIYKVAAPVTVDGTIDAVWNNASVLPAAAAKLLSGTVTNSADLSGNFKALWDDTYLYVLADVSDELKVNESTNVYDDDAVEVYIDINNDKATAYGANDVQYTFGWNDGTTVGMLPAGRAVTGITYSAVARTGGYIVEARIPWTTLQGTPAIGQLVGVDFMINDDDDNGTRDGKLAWNAATDNAWQDPSIFGTAILQGLLACSTPAAPAVTATVTYCQNATATQLTATGTGLKWYADNTTTTALAAAPTPSTTAAGSTSYFVSQTTSGCESARAQITVTVNALPAAAITAGSSTTFCTGGSVTLTSSTGSSYIWKNGTTQVGTSATYAATAAGSYTVEVTNANMCKATSTATVVTVNTPPTAPTVTTPVVYCQNATATQLTATGAALKWYADNTTTTALAAAPTPSTTAAGSTSYFVSQTTSGCESARAQITVTVNALPTATITAGGATAFCSGGSVTLTSSAGTSYIWKNGTTQVGTAATYAATAAGSYTVEVTNANNCKATSVTTVVTINTAGSAPTVTSTVAYCEGETATQLTASGTSLKWYSDNTTTTALAAAPTPSTAAAGSTSYFVSQTTSGCESARAQITVTVNALPTATITTIGSTAICTGGSVTLTSNAGTSYIWKNGTTQVGTSATYAATTAGSYTVEVTNANTCKATSAATVVTVNALPAATITAGGATAFCSGGSVTLTSSAGTSYIWKNGTTQVGTSATYTATAAGSYTVEVTNANTCKAISTATVVTINTAGSAPAVTATVAYCQNAAATQLTASGTSLKWYADNTTTTALATAPTPSTATAGSTSYFVSQTTSGCESPRAQITVTVNGLPTATITAGGATAFCSGGSVTLTSSAGSSYIWKNGTTQVGTSATYAATAAGSYTVEVMNANTCKATSTATVVTIGTPPAAPTVTAATAYCQNAAATQLTASGTSLKWYADNTTTTALATAPTPSTATAGSTSYFVSQSTNGCESSRAQIAVTINALPTAVITPSSTTTIPAGGSVTLNANTGSGLLYKWFNGSTQAGTAASYTATTVGSYVVEVTNAGGCKATSLAVDVTNASNQPSQITIISPSANASITGTITITANVSDPDGTITLVEYLDGNTVIGTSSVQPYTFDWTNPGTGNHVITVRVTDSNGGITTSAPVTITSSTISTGVNYSANISATVYPNPSNGDVYVETDMDLSNAHFRVVNVLGEEAVISASVDASGARLDVSGLTEGAYILIITEGTSILRKKITVMR